MKSFPLRRFFNPAVFFIAAGFFFVGGALTVQAESCGRELFQFHCAQCHGVNGDGKGINATEDLPTAPKDFTDKKVLPVFSDAQIINTVTHGGPKEQLSFIMPAWGDILSDNEIECLRVRLREICNCSYDPEAAAKAAAEQ